MFKLECALMLLLAVTAPIWADDTTPKPSVDCTPTVADLDTSKLSSAPIPADNGAALVRMVGFFGFPGFDGQYRRQPLDVHRIYSDPIMATRVHLDNQCAQIRLLFNKSSSKSRISLDVIEVDFESPQMGGKHCYLIPKINVDMFMHYRCLKQTRYVLTCDWFKGPSGSEGPELVLDQFEFELDSNRTLARQGQFKYRPQDC